KKASAWYEKLDHLCRTNPDFSSYYHHCFVEEDFSTLKPTLWDSAKPVATRVAFGEVLKNWATCLPNLIGGSADLEPSNMTEAFAKIVGDFAVDQPSGRNIVFGVREFAMTAICNGIALHGGLIPFSATFLSFSDYSRPALRLGALQRCRVIHEFTHDSF